jgi:hypothetical protein
MTVVNAPIPSGWLKRATSHDARNCTPGNRLRQTGAYDPVERYDEGLRNRLLLDRKAGTGAIVAR